MGFTFSPKEDILVTQLGRKLPDTGSRYVTLFDSDTQAILEQLQVSGVSGEYSYAPLTSPRWLTKDKAYDIAVYVSSSGYYLASNNKFDSHITPIESCECNSCGQNGFPNTNFAYPSYPQVGLADISFYTKTNLANPPSIALSSCVSQ